VSIVFTGAGGQLGRAIAALAAQRGVAATGFDHAALDIADEAAVAAKCAGAKVVINAAAFTDVDGAEGDILGAWRVNCTGPMVLADWCAQNGAALIHISTDYVFDGRKRKPYTEKDEITPLGAYGASKAEGEAEIVQRLDQHVILRTAWLFSATGRNFVRSMVNAGLARTELTVVSDRHGSPTFAGHLAEAVLDIAAKITAGKNRKWGIYHYAGAPAATWFTFAEDIFRHHPRQPRLVPIAGKDWPAPAPRPDNSVLDCSKLKKDFDIAQPDWRPAVADVVRALTGGVK
jgi:dTDP-4-dehydrorhamnose reductase